VEAANKTLLGLLLVVVAVLVQWAATQAVRQWVVLVVLVQTFRLF
jgi:hypothetical protein